MNVRMYVCMLVYVHANMHVFVLACVRACSHVCVCVRACVRKYVCIGTCKHKTLILQPTVKGSEQIFMFLFMKWTFYVALK